MTDRTTVQMTAPEPTADQVAAIIRRDAEPASRCVLPVVDVAEGSARRRANGSAVVVRVGERAFALTARHVIDEATQSVVYGPIGTVRLGENPIRPVGSFANDEQIDVVAYELSGDGLSALGLRFDDLVQLPRANPLQPPGDLYVAIGNPTSKADLKEAQTVLEGQTMLVLTASLPHDAYASRNRDPRMHLLVSYDPAIFRDGDGGDRRGAQPKGLSGGGLFWYRWKDPQTKDALQFVVSGILITFRKPPDAVLVATKIQLLIGGIVARYPELGPFVPYF